MSDNSSLTTRVRSFFKRNIPGIVHVHNIYTNRKFKGKSTSEVFNQIYSENAWGNSESVSGEGSEISQARELIDNLPGLLKRHDIKSLLDLPCGDFNWMNEVDLSGIDYIGADIVPELVNANQQRHGRENVSFQHLDLTCDPLPGADAVFIRDCLVHLSYELIVEALRNIRACGIRYLIVTSYPRSDNNYDIVTGGWRKLNFEKAPFHFPPAKDFIDEKCQEGAYFADKVMALWDMKDLDLDGISLKQG